MGASLSDEPEERRPHGRHNVDRDNAKMDVK
jgi:hypothetical protein